MLWYSFNQLGAPDSCGKWSLRVSWSQIHWTCDARNTSWKSVLLFIPLLPSHLLLYLCDLTVEDVGGNLASFLLPSTFLRIWDDSFCLHPPRISLERNFPRVDVRWCQDQWTRLFMWINIFEKDNLIVIMWVPSAPFDTFHSVSMIM